MTNLKTTKRALLSSVVALLVCFTMLLGTTFAWFTDSVTSNGNIIQTGTLEIGMYWAEGDEAVPTATEDWKDASQGAIFNNTKWEPGYVEAKHIKIANEGTLALKYKLLIFPNGEVEALADVIDVYYVKGATQVTRDTLPETAVLVGTLRDMIEDTDGAVHGALLPVGETATDTYEEVGEVTATIAFKMREEAGNEYKGMSIGTDFSIQLLATQYTFEEDSFDNQYDKDAEFPVPVSNATELIDSLKAGKDVVFMEDIEISEQISVSDQSVTIDLAGNELSFGKSPDAISGSIIGVAGEGTLNLVNTSDEVIELDCSQGCEIVEGMYIPNISVLEGKLNIENINIVTSSDSIPAIEIRNGATVNMNGGTIVASGTCPPVNVHHDSTFNMNAGEIKINNESSLGAIMVDTIKGKTPAVVNLLGGKISVNNASSPILYIVKYDVNINYTEEFVMEGTTTLYKTDDSGYTRNITVNGVVQ